VRELDNKKQIIWSHNVRKLR